MSISSKDYISTFADKTILVLGDSMVDVYLRGESSRLSPEAPVPVVDIHTRDMCPGGAANTVLTLCALGARVHYISVVGDDHDGLWLQKTLAHAGANIESTIRVPHRHTLVKSRVMAGDHILIRYDSGTHTPLDIGTEETLIEKIKTLYPSCDAVLISDYDKGIITPAVLQTLTGLMDIQPRYFAVDSKRLSFFKPLEPSLVKPNYEEAIRLLHLPATSSSRVQQLSPFIGQLSSSTAADITVVTLDNEGVLVIQPGSETYHAPALPVQSPQVAGAGDVFISTFLLAQLSNADVKESTDIALAAAAIAISKHGTASCSRHELAAHFTQCEKCITSSEALRHMCLLYKAQGKRVVFTNGCFDILHSGHVSYLNQARALGDVLIVGINNDESIRRIKGHLRPINPLNDRIDVLAGLVAVDHIVAFGNENDDTPIPVIDVVRPHVFVKGGDYAGKSLPEASTVERHGGRIVILPLLPDHSTSRIIDRVQQAHALAG